MGGDGGIDEDAAILGALEEDAVECRGVAIRPSRRG